MDTSKTFGRYEILEELGHGAMGTVYRAKDPPMERIVALKTINSVAIVSHQGIEFRERFYREARAAGRLAHPGIVPVFDVGEQEGLPYLVMEFISGQTLADALKGKERMTLDRVCEIGQQIAEALGYAHQHGVVHRDIKPANILLTSRETYGIERPKITDFGVAKLAAGQLTSSGQMVGTPAFMPPEQFTGAPIDGRADLFSLGVILYWMTTGEQPFPGETVTAVSYKVVHTEPVPPQKLNPSIPPQLESVILKCLAKNPSSRYQTGEELARDLAEYRTGTTATGLRTAVPASTLTKIDSDATQIGVPSQEPRWQAATPAREQVTVGVAGKRMDNRFLLAAVAAVAAVAIAIGGWYVLRNNRKDIPKQVASTEAPVITNPPEVTAAPVAPPARAIASAPQQAVVAVASPAAAGINGENAPRKITKKAEAVAVDFDPKTLDPKKNAKLKIDAQQMPANLNFTVEMNGKIYFQRGAAGNKAEYEDLLLPPGVQEFRVTADSGAVQKVSNIVSAEFKAKKRKTLKIELRTQGTTGKSGTPQDLYPDAEIFVTLK